MPNTQTEDLGGIKLVNKIHAVSNPEKRDHEHHYKGRNLGNPPILGEWYSAHVRIEANRQCC